MLCSNSLLWAFHLAPVMPVTEKKKKKKEKKIGWMNQTDIHELDYYRYILNTEIIKCPLSLQKHEWGRSLCTFWYCGLLYTSSYQNEWISRFASDPYLPPSTLTRSSVSFWQEKRYVWLRGKNYSVRLRKTLWFDLK